MPDKGQLYIEDDYRYTNVCKGLYYLQSFLISDHDFIHKYILSYKRVDVNLWHYRLGNPRHKVVQQICKNFPYVQMNFDIVCDTCHYVKQHKLSFPKRASLSTECFEIIQCDIWGPISIPFDHGHGLYCS